ncbi:MAG: RluA family pseudouridine synthase [Helicobacteraceae bacterium]|jgi:23S rRNA pseudouridine1911/1915/1917 synthase|nr:RluA family pseudouridine synthase [Helicobacteraceae bacterium]
MRLQVSLETRADRFVADALKIGRNEALKLIKNGFVIGAKKPSQTLKSGAIVVVKTPPKPQENAPPSVDFDIPILYEDDELLAIDKPAGVVAHSAPSYKGAVLVDWLKAKGFALSNIAGEERLGIVHRLDKETTGVLAIAKTNAAHVALSRQLESREMGRYYLAIVDRGLKRDLIVDRPIGRSPKNRVKMAVVPNGREAKSAFIELAQLENGEALIAAKLFSGRTHQIRVHLQSIGVHIVGDRLYGYKGAQDKIGAILLHAYRLYLRRPSSGEALAVEAPLPESFLKRLNLNGGCINEILGESNVLSRFGAIDGVRSATENSVGSQGR